jgi:hypothetical protein
MKAISFLEYYKNQFKSSLKDEEFVIHTLIYHRKVSQPFSFEKVAELFEGFEFYGIEGEWDFYMLQTKSDICFDYKDDSFNITSMFEGDLPDNRDYSTNILPKTIDEFIVLCNNLNIELQWKQN